MNGIKSEKSPPRFFCLESLPIFGLLVLLIIFYPGLFFAKEASLMGDHWVQHYPWGFLMARSLQQGVLPFWTPLIQCGFPIAAESQIGLFYLPNLILYAFLPFNVAYAYMNPVHFLLAGIGTYLYSRKLGINHVGAFVAGIVFVFGAGYGGAFYNITSLKTLAWFPWILWTFEVFQESLRKRYVFLAAFFISLSILAGYLQVAAFMLFFCAVYFLLRVLAFPRQDRTWGQRLMGGGGMLGAAIVAVWLSLPQLYLTFELSQFSNRINLSEGYAYVGSLLPFALLTIVFPNLQGFFRGSCLYSGIFALVFVTASFWIAAKSLRKMLWLWITLSILSLLLAFGQWSPLYIAIIKITHFYSFRIPAKFLIFFCFGMAILSGLGAHAISVDLKDNDKKNEFINRCFALTMSVLAFWGGAYFFLTWGRSWSVGLGEWMIRNFIYDKPGRPRSLEAYLKDAETLFDKTREALSLTDPWMILAFVLILLVCVWLVFFKRNVRQVVLLSIAIGILLVDLYVLAGADIKKDFDTYHNVLKVDAITQTLLSEKTAGKVGRFYGYRKESESLPLMPSANMLFGIEDIGGYSPLTMGRYFETIGQFGNVNDSNKMFEAAPDFVLERIPLLSSLDVSHIVAARELRHPDLELMARDPVSQAYLYRNQQEHVRGYFIGGTVFFADWPVLKQMLMAPGFDPRKVLLLENSEINKIRGVRLNASSRALTVVRTHHENVKEEWLLETTGPGFFVLTNTMYPGWRARLNGKNAPILCAYGLFQAIYLSSAGRYTIEFKYVPFHFLRHQA